MENRRVLKSTLIIFALLWGAFSFSYVSAYSADTTHPALTDEVVDFYNHFYPQTALTDDEKQLIVSGASGEDAPMARVLNHFYDPVRNRGLFGYISAKTWITSTKTQVLSALNFTAGTTQPLYSEVEDYSWERSIYEYVHGSKGRGLIGLGHALHLIEDMAVPEHTRNDQHLIGIDTSPYELWASQFTPQNLTTAQELISQHKTPVLYNSIDTYLDQVALFTNNHFFSKDTLPFPEAGFSSIPKEKYPIPDYTVVGVGLLSGGKLQSYGISVIEGRQYKLFELQEQKSKKTKSGIEKEYKIYNDKGEQVIFEDYWGILSKEVVMNGAGVVNLFFDEVEKEKETLALYYKNRSLLGKFRDSMQGAIFSVSKGLYGSSVSYSEVQELVADKNVQKVPVVVEQIENEVFVDESPKEESVEGIAEPENVVDSVSNDIQPEEIEVETTTVIEIEPEIPGLIPVVTPFFGGGGGGPLKIKQAQEAEAAIEVAESLVVAVSSPESGSLFTTNTVTFSGTSSPLAVISQDFSSGTTTTNSGGEWEMAMSGFAEGSTTIAFLATNAEGITSDSVSIIVSVDTISPTFSSFEVLECSYSLRSDACLSGSSSVNLLWTSTSTDISYYAIVVNDVEFSTTTNTTNIATLSGSSATVAVVAYDAVGNSATSTTQSVEIFDTPIVINEIAWAGTQTGAAGVVGASDEWIELYNRTGHELDLSHTVLYAEDLVPYLELSGTVSAGGHYLIERTSSTTTSVNENLAVVFSGLGGGSGLSNGGEKLILAQSLGGNATTTLDQTPDVSTCSGWCAGDNTTNPRSMERKSPNIVGSASSSWESNNTFTKNGTDAGGNAINGTPKAQNSVNILSIGYYCPPESVSFVEGGYYTPSSGGCTYLSSELSGPRYGDLYRGTVASSTILTGHLLSNAESLQQGDIISSPIQGEDIFVAIYELQNSLDYVPFHAFFQTGSSSPPHLNYGVVRWKYGTTP